MKRTMQFLIVLVALMAAIIGTGAYVLAQEKAPTTTAGTVPAAATPDPANATARAAGPSLAPVAERLSFLEGVLSVLGNRCWNQCPPPAVAKAPTVPANTAPTRARTTAKTPKPPVAPPATAVTTSPVPTYTCRLDVTGDAAVTKAVGQVNYVECGPKAASTPPATPPPAAPSAAAAAVAPTPPTPPVQTVRIEIVRAPSAYDNLNNIAGPRYRGEDPPAAVQEYIPIHPTPRPTEIPAKAPCRGRC